MILCTQVQIVLEYIKILERGGIKMDNIKSKTEICFKEICEHLENGIISFWLKNGIDTECGGYLTSYNSKGKVMTDTDKYIIIQTRMIWGLSSLYRIFPDNKDLLREAKQGVEFFIKNFYDNEYGGWFWKTKRDGEVIDDGKVVYGQGFAIYALAEYTLATGDPIGLEYAEKTFDLLQKFCTDTYHGGYYENLERDWSISEPGFAAGDRKSLDIHMHLLEAFSTLALCTQKEIHKRKLKEVIDIILDKMVNKEIGCGMNQFDLSFNPIPAINIRRTWNAERKTGVTVEKPTDTTSYGHNLEMIWLLNRAGEILNLSHNYFNGVNLKLVEHSLKYGFDHELGGVYRDGLSNGPALVTDKEWWQNCEALVGYLDAYESFGDIKYFEAFYKTWDFDKKYLIDEKLGEWYQLVDKYGKIISDDVGNPWKAIYHTGRAMMECRLRLIKILNK